MKIEEYIDRLDEISKKTKSQKWYVDPSTREQMDALFQSRDATLTLIKLVRKYREFFNEILRCETEKINDDGFFPSEEATLAIYALSINVEDLKE